ncbi:MAG: TlpA disulfide reductase family protein [Propionibacteriaceae bacterium]|nr:TlpA disulfide reductase family protein [Propionibacteriaceae bacterium]
MRRVAVAVVASLLALSSCSTPAAPTPTQPSVSATADLDVLRVEYGLPECPGTDPQAEQVAGGLPRTELPCLGTDQVVNLAGLPREAMVVNFWAQWCGPCREESLFLTEAFEGMDDVSFIGINYQDPQPDWAIEFAGLVGWKYPHIQDMERTLKTSLKVPGLPVTLFVSADGRIAGRHVGGIQSTEELRGLIDEYLGKA